MFSRVRKYWSFTENERYGLAGVALFLGFMFSFKSGGATHPDLTTWITAVLTTIGMTFAGVWIHLFGQKQISLFWGYTVQWTMEVRGLLGTLLLWFLSGGYIVLPVYGTITVNPIQELRFGKKPGFKFYHLGWIAATGSITNLGLALLLKYLWTIFPNETIAHFAFINIIIAIAMALPLPWADGIHLFFASRLDYVTYFGTLLFFSLLFLGNLPIIWLIPLTVLFAGTVWGAYWLIEKNIK